MSTSDHTTKRCSGCKEAYPLTADFWHKDNSQKSGFRSRCRECVKEMLRAYANSHRQEANERLAKWRVKNPERDKEINLAARSKRRDKIIVYSRQYRIDNRDRNLAYERKYRAEHPEVAQTSSNRRRARKRKAEGSHSTQEVIALFEKQDGKCFHCDIDISQYYEQDHWIPLDKGGTDYIQNIRLLCRTCNRKKYNKLPHEWCPERYSKDE